MTTNANPVRTPAEVGEAYFQAWRDHDVDTLRDLLGDEIVFDGPLGHVEGGEQNAQALAGLLQIVTGVTIHRVLADGPDVMTWYDLHTSVADPAPTVNWSRVQNGRIVRMRVTFDPRGLLAAG